MKFVPRDPGEAAENSSGGGSRGGWSELRKLVIFAAAAIVLLWAGFQALGWIAVRVITPEQEAAMLGKLLPGLEIWEPDSEAGQAQLAKAQRILDQLTTHPEVPRLDYRLVVVDEDDPNAFAFPGGTIGVTRGLLEEIDNDSEIPLAFVLGHELGHFKNRDHLRGIIRQAGAGITLSVLFGGGGAASLTSKAGELMELGYSRAQEHAADDFGILLLRETYPDTAGAERFFEMVLEGDDPPAWAYMFFTHPDPRKRIKRLQPGQ